MPPHSVRDGTVQKSMSVEGAMSSWMETPGQGKESREEKRRESALGR